MTWFKAERVGDCYVLYARHWLFWWLWRDAGFPPVPIPDNHLKYLRDKS
jgi:hypothetical protein